MPVIKDVTRQNAFSHRLKRKREKLSDEKTEMTGDQLKVLKGFIADANRNVLNAFLVFKEPSPDQAKSIDDDLNQLAERIEQIRERVSLDAQQTRPDTF